MLSVVIPSYKSPYLNKMIDSVLTNSGLSDDQIEVIPVLDGVDAVEPIIDDPRVKVVRLGNNVGMRGAINAGVRISKGDYILRGDDHCMFAERFGLILTSQCEPNWIVTARRYFLDPVKWEVMDIPPVDYEKLVIQRTPLGRKFAGKRWDRPSRKDIPIDETFAMQGSMWMMPHKWWDEVIGELQIEGYGPLIQDSHEMTFKTWRAGGKLMLNKNTWFAHKHVSFPRTHNNGSKENPANCEYGYAYALKVWEDYYHSDIEPRQNALMEQDKEESQEVYE